MALERFPALDLAGRGLLKAFSCAFVCFQFRHNLISAACRGLEQIALSNWQLAKAKPGQPMLENQRQAWRTADTIRLKLIAGGYLLIALQL
jgi:hypothetical protein